MSDFPFHLLIPFSLGVGLLVEAFFAHTDPPRYLAWVAKRSFRVTRHTDQEKLVYGRYVYPLVGLGLMGMATLSFLGLI